MGRDTLTACLNNTVLHPGVHAFTFRGLILCHWKETYRVYVHHSRPWPCFIRFRRVSLCRAICEHRVAYSHLLLLYFKNSVKARGEPWMRRWLFHLSAQSCFFSFCFVEAERLRTTGRDEGGLRQSASVPRWAARRTGWSVVNTHAAGHTKWNVNSLVNYHKQCSQTQNRGTHTECKTSDLLFSHTHTRI